MKHIAISLSSAVITLSSQGLVQAAGDVEDTLEEVIVTGSHIKGAKVTETLPVTIFGQDDLDALGSFDGDELIRSLPGQGEVDFRDDNNNTVNNSRGDVSSINLRSLGPGNTLVLINSRRVVNHPGTQSKNLVPAVTPNMNALPVAGIQRVEVLNDGAASLYGSDAVAGVFNAILKRNFEGLDISVRGSFAENSGLNEQQITLNAGKSFNDGRTNISLAGSFSIRDGLHSSEVPLAANSDTRDLLIGTTFEDDNSFDNRHTRTAWGQFTLKTRVSQNGESLTSSSGRFHIQPTTFVENACRGTTENDLATPGICIDDGSLDRDLRHNRGADRSLISDRDRVNVFAFLNHEFDDNIELYGELGYYRAETDATIEAITPISSGDIVVPANNYWNPFGPVNFSDGTLNPNRLPGLDIPIEGLPVFVDGARYRFTELGPRNVNVVNTSFRSLIGARGDFGQSGWDWDTAVLYSRARTTDITDNRVSSTLFAAALDNETPDAFNVFNGADPNNPNSLDSTTNPQSVIDTFLIDVQRQSTTELALADFKVSKGDVFELPAGPVGVAFGVEVRYESYDEDRDDRLDGTITFTNPVNGAFSLSDAMGSSATRDSSGSREVYSAFGEVLVPLLSENQNIPLVHELSVQLAGRIEEFSDIGSSGFKPRVAGTWGLFDWLKARGSWAKGFKAPNLPQLNEISVARSNTREDSIFCEAGVRNGTFAEFADCSGFSESREERRNSNPDLEPEDNETKTFGIVIDPQDLEGDLSFLNGFSFTVDWWDTEQTDVVGIFGGANHVNLDYALRVQGSSNPNVVRADPTVDQVAFFAGTGIDAIGDILFITDKYLNLLPRSFQGVDFGLYYDLYDTPLGDFKFKINASKLKQFDVKESERDLVILDAIAAGEIDPSITVDGAGSLLERNGAPEWRGSASLTWRHQSGFGAGFVANYVGDFIDTSAGPDSNGDPHIIEQWITANMYIQYEHEGNGILANTRARFGINNFTDEAPRHDDEIRGFKSSMHNARGREFYLDISKKF